MVLLLMLSVIFLCILLLGIIGYKDNKTREKYCGLKDKGHNPAPAFCDDYPDCVNCPYKKRRV